MRFSKGLILFMTMLLMVVMVFGCSGQTTAPASEGEEPAPGEESAVSEDEATEPVKVQGEGQGFNADVPIKVEVTLDDGVITDIVVLEHGETEGVCDPAIEAIPQAIIDAQSTTVDAVSGATMTSGGIMEAVANAIGE